MYLFLELRVSHTQYVAAAAAVNDLTVVSSVAAAGDGGGLFVAAAVADGDCLVSALCHQVIVCSRVG